VTYTVTVRVNPAAVGLLVNAVTATVPQGIIDPDLTNNTATDTDTLIPTADLRVRKTSNWLVVSPGGSLTYIIRVTNLGPSTVTGFQLTDVFPAAFTPNTFTPSAGTFDPATGTWTGLTLATGQTVVLRVAGRVAPTATGRLVNSVRVSPAQGLVDPNLSNNFAAHTVNVARPSKRWFIF
ncbi:MAG TPA: DUF11 domain-containing protein, partial [Gemmataceae bacterium]|nr:DUF11 domain-containing protein [Gemmataceae bacterium]